MGIWYYAIMGIMRLWDYVRDRDRHLRPICSSFGLTS